MTAGEALASAATEVVTVGAQHVRQRRALAIDLRRRPAGRAAHLDRMKSSGIEQRPERIRPRGERAIVRGVEVREDRDATGRDDLVHHHDRRGVRGNVARAPGPAVMDGPQQRVDRCCRGIRRKHGEHMCAAVRGDLDTRKQGERPEPVWPVARERYQRCLERVDPHPAVVVRHHHRLDPGPHERQEPSGGRRLAKVLALGRPLPKIGRSRRVRVDVHLPPRGT